MDSNKSKVILNEEQYHNLCNSADYILNERKSSIPCVSIASLHIIREHPQFLKKYLVLLDNTFFSQIKKLLTITAVWLRHLVLSFFVNKSLWISSSSVEEEIDVLFVSHILNKNYNLAEGDFYFEHIPKILQNYGVKSGIALINHTKYKTPVDVSKLEKNGTLYFLLRKRLRLISELTFLIQLINEAFFLKKIKKANGNPFFSNFLTGILYDLFSRTTVHSLRLNKQIGALVKESKPKLMIITYEGHAWERTVMAAARESIPTIKCIGYQHAIIFRLQHAIKKSLSSKLDPDVLFCSGLIGKKQLDEVLELSDIPKFVLGSNRSVNETHVFSKEIFHQHSKLVSNYCLVLPEGDISECNLLFEFSLACAKKFTYLQFIWRLHPLITFETLISKNRKFKDLPFNIILSTDSLLNDIKKCGTALYRGTTAIISAAHYGLKPIYLAIEGEMTIDPLCGINSSTNYVYEVTDFEKKTQQVITWEQYIETQEYCSKILQPLNYGVLKQQLGGVNY